MMTFSSEKPVLDIAKPPQETRVVVAMSGGVDSSVTAALLVEAGYQVIGMTMQLYDQGQMTAQRKGACCAGQDIYDARMVADRLDIPHYVLDYESRFRQSVIEDFVDSYVQGYTPIPCVRCNQTVKFKDLLQAAQDLGADALATGHYVQRIRVADAVELHCGLDPGKDQSFFLFATTPDQLAYVHFPLGHLSKDQTRAHAHRLGLTTADKPDSQDICFVAGGNYASVVEKLRPGSLEPGLIRDLEGHVLGEHRGTIGYTVGQRRGLGVQSAEPLYVIGIDASKKEVIVGPRSALACQDMTLTDLNWLSDIPRHIPQHVMVKIRSAQTPAPAQLIRDLSGARVSLEAPEYGVAPGQACVFYEGTRVLGGGWIASTDAMAKLHR